MPREEVFWTFSFLDEQEEQGPVVVILFWVVMGIYRDCDTKDPYGIITPLV